MIEVMENVELSITSHQKYKLFLFLCNAERYKENLPAIEQLLLIVLGLKVKLRLEVHEIDETVYLSVGSGCVGQTLGLNGLMISETDDLTATIILDTPTDDYEEVKRIYPMSAGYLNFSSFQQEISKLIIWYVEKRILYSEKTD